MSSQSCTPGPWYVMREGDVSGADLSIYALTPDHSNRVVSLRRYIGRAYGEGPGIGTRSGCDDERNANANLMAAAPDLYAALVELLAAPNKRRPARVWEAAAFAVGRAEGRLT